MSDFCPFQNRNSLSINPVIKIELITFSELKFLSLSLMTDSNITHQTPLAMVCRFMLQEAFVNPMKFNCILLYFNIEIALLSYESDMIDIAQNLTSEFRPHRAKLLKILRLAVHSSFSFFDQILSAKCL